MADYIVDKEIFIIGMNRCGQHAICSWLSGMVNKAFFRGNFIDIENYKNNIKSANYREFFHLNRPFLIGRNIKDRRIFVWRNPDKEISEIDTFIVGGENCSPKDFKEWYDIYFEKCRYSFLKRMTLSFKKYRRATSLSKEKYYISVIRSPWNHAASCLKWKDEQNHFINIPNNFIPLWKFYANEYLKNTKYIMEPNICINYDKWFKNIEYRKEIAKFLGLEFSDERINHIQNCGYGSSFTGKKNDEKAQELKTLERYKYYIETKPEYKNRYLSIFNDKELIELSEKIFEIPKIIKENL